MQEHDTAADRLQHRRATLPELAELAKVEAEVASVERALASAGARRDEVARKQKALEDELAGVEGKSAEVQKRMYSGAVTIPRELQAMQAEVEALKRRASGLEDEILERMTEREPLDCELDGLVAALGAQDAEGARLRVAVAEAQSEIDAELAREQSARAEAAANIPEPLAKLYGQLRARLGGVGAARLVGNRCSGCHLTLPAVEVDRIRHEPPDALIRCDQCSRILVR